MQQHALKVLGNYRKNVQRDKRDALKEHDAKMRDQIQAWEASDNKERKVGLMPMSQTVMTMNRADIYEAWFEERKAITEKYDNTLAQWTKHIEKVKGEYLEKNGPDIEATQRSTIERSSKIDRER